MTVMQMIEQVESWASTLGAWDLNYDCFPVLAEILPPLPYGAEQAEAYLQLAAEQRSASY